MPLTNTQHDAIMRIYDTIRTDNRHLLEARYQEVAARCPQLTAIEDEIISLSVRCAASMIGGTPADYKTELSALEARRTQCLVSIGKPADYLDEIYTCPKCHDTGYIGQHKCECFHKKAVDLVYHDSNLKNITESENFRTFSFEWYDNTAKNPANGLTPYHNMQKVVSICHAFVDNFDTAFSNLLLFGDTGVGKTFLTNCIAKELLDSSHSVIYLTAIELFERFAQQDFGKASEPMLPSSSYILDCDLLIIDDLGTEVGNTYTNSKLFYCINERILRRKSVVISTNLSLSDIRDTYSERIFSRLTSAYTILKLFGADIRILKRTGKANAGKKNI